MKKEIKEKKKKLDLTMFLKKVLEAEMKRVKVLEIEVENFGVIEFIRPKEGILLNYLASIIKSSKVKKNSEDIEVKEIDFKELLNASSEFIYNCCTLLQSKEVRNQYSDRDPYEIPGIIFGTNETIRLAGELNEAFGRGKIVELIHNEIKNL